MFNIGDKVLLDGKSYIVTLLDLDMEAADLVSLCGEYHITALFCELTLDTQMELF